MPGATQSHGRGNFRGRVLDNRLICPDHYRLRLLVEHFPPSSPGQFVNIQCGSVEGIVEPRQADWPDGRPPRLSQPELTSRQPLLRRPFSLAGRRDMASGSTELEVMHRVVGAGTAWLAQLTADAELSLLGPLGSGFTVSAQRPMAAVLGGGVGIPPMLYLVEALTAAGKEVVAFAGARTGRALPLASAGAEPPSPAARPTMCTAEFAEKGVATVVATDDGSLGFRGLVHEAFARWLAQRRPGPADLTVYACGPEPMMKAVGDLCLGRGIECQLALERYMACGMGTCQSCVCKTRADGKPGWQFKLVCKDGPVFRAEELVWD